MIKNTATHTFEHNESNYTSPYSFLSSFLPTINYKHALILDNTPLEFHGGSAIQLHAPAGHAFRVKSGNYYHSNAQTATTNLSIPNGEEKQLIFLDDSNAVFYNRLKHINGKRYVLEDEVNTLEPSKFSTAYYFQEGDFLYIDESKKYITRK
jgi:hypothetical protein